MKKHCIRLFFSFLFFFCLTKLWGQDILISGTDFNPRTGYENSFYLDQNNIVYEGLQPATWLYIPSFPLTVNNDDFRADYNFAITNNPHNLTSADDYYVDLADEDEWMMVVSIPSTNQNILHIVANDLIPGSAVRVEIEYMNPISVESGCSAWSQSSFKGIFNPDQWNRLNGIESTQLNPGDEGTVVFRGVADANGTMNFYMSTQQITECSALAFKSINIYGQAQPSLLADEEVCAGDMIAIGTKLNYNANYSWEVNNGSGWTSAGSNQTLLYEATTVGDYRFRLNVTNNGRTFTSEIFTSTAITCCEIDGAPASRQTVYFDDFGHFEIGDPYTLYYTDYSDIINPTNETRRVTQPYRYELDVPPTGHIYQPVGPPYDRPNENPPYGEYCVAAYISSNEGSAMGWGSKIHGINSDPNPNYDHSGELGGAALFINVVSDIGSIIYEREIEDLCLGTPLFFECYITVFTDDTEPVDVSVTLSELGNPSNSVTVNEGATGTGGTGYWHKISSELTLISNSTLLLQIANNNDESEHGNDLVLDDIKVMACSSPALNLYFDISTTSTETEVCVDPIALHASYTDMLTNFYNGNPRFIYQWTTTPNNERSWTNYGTPVSDITHVISDPLSDVAISGLTQDEKVYFRVIASSEAVFNDRNNFTGTDYAREHDPCKNYSVSPPIQATYTCPQCTRPVFTGLSLSFDEDTILCPGTSTTISAEVFPDNQPDIDYLYYRSASATYSESNAIGSSRNGDFGFDDLTVDFSEAGAWYTLKMWDGELPDELQCYVEHQIFIGTAPAPTFSFTSVDDVCEYLPITAPRIEFNGESDYSFTLVTNFTNPQGISSAPVSQTLASNSDSYTIVAPSAPGTYTYSLTTLTDANCDAMTLTATESFTIYDQPEVELQDPTDACVYSANPIIVRPTASSPTAGTGVYSSTSATVNSSTGYVNPALSGPGSHTVQYIFTETATSCADTATIELQVFPKPDVNFALQTDICETASPIMLTATQTGTPLEGSDTWSLVGATAPSVAGGSFNPSGIADEETRTIRYIFNSNDGCSDTAEHTITIHNIPAPSTEETSVNYQYIETELDTMVAKGINNAQFAWYSDVSLTTNVLNEVQSDGESYYKSVRALNLPVPIDADVVFTYYVTQTIYGCTSPAAPVTTTVSACPVDPPVLTDMEICLNESVPQLTAVPQGIGPVHWLNASGIEVEDDATSITPSLDGTLATSVTYTAYQYSTQYHCESPRSSVTFTVNPLPVPTIVMGNTNFCSDDSNPASILLSPVGGTLTGSPAISYSGTGNRGTYIPANEIIFNNTVTLNYHVTDENNCQNETTLDIFVTQTDTVSANGSQILTTAVTPLPITANPYEGELHWYDESGNEIFSAVGQDTWVPSLPTDANGFVVGTYTFYVSQMINDCESARIPFEYVVISCPAPRPIGNPESYCFEVEPTPSVSATAVNPAHNANLYWFANISDIGVRPEQSIGSTLTTSLFAVGTTTFYVAEFDVTEQCFGPAEAVTLTINPLPNPTLTPASPQICYGDVIILTPMPAGGRLLNPTGGVMTSNVFTPTAQETATYGFTYIYTDGNGCVDTARTMVISRYVAPPVTEDVSFSQDTTDPDPIPPVIASGENGACFYWYDASGSALANTSCSEQYFSTDGREGTQVFWVEQEIDGCRSERTRVALDISYCPMPAPLGFGGAQCVYDDPLLVSAQVHPSYTGSVGNEQFRWYMSPTQDIHQPSATTNPYQYGGVIPNITTQTTVYVRVYEPDFPCVSAATPVVIQFNKTLSPDLVDINNICEVDDPLPRLRSTSIGNINWYSDAALSISIGTGTQIPVPASDFVDGTYTYYATNTNPLTGCVSEPSEVSYTIYPKPGLPTVEDRSVCENKPSDGFYLEAQANADGYTQLWHWTNESGIVSGSDARVNLPSSLHSFGVFKYTVEGESVYGCYSDPVTGTLTLRETPPVPEFANKEAICKGSEPSSTIEVINYLGGDDIFWRIDGSLNKEGPMPNYELNLEGRNVGNVLIEAWSVRDGCVSESNSSNLFIWPVPNVKLNILRDSSRYPVPEVFCQSEDPVTLQAVDIEEDGIDPPTFSIEGLTYGLNPLQKMIGTDDLFFLEPRNIGNDSIIVNASNTYCSDKDTIPIYVIPNPKPILESAPNYGTGMVLFNHDTYQGTVNGLEVPELTVFELEYGLTKEEMWDTIEELDFPVAKAYVYGEYIVQLRVTNEYGCDTTVVDSFPMRVTKGLFVPTAFAPDFIGQAGIFLPKGHNLKEYRLYIYDCWGNMVFFSDELMPPAGIPYIGWDGRDMDGNLLKSDYYVWKIEATFNDNSVWEGQASGNKAKKTYGNVFLIR